MNTWVLLRELPEFIAGAKGENVATFAKSIKDYYTYPVDIQVLSPDATVIMHQPQSKLPKNDQARGYLMLLDYPFTEKLPLTADQMRARQPLLSVSDTFRAPGAGYQDYTPVEIDTTAYEAGGILILDIRVGTGEATGSFDLYAGDVELPTEGFPLDAVTSVWDIPPGVAGQIVYPFTQGQRFKLGATGNWFCEKGSTNTFEVRASVVPTETEK